MSEEKGATGAADAARRVEVLVGLDADLPGELALSLAVQRGEWPHTMDSAIWAEKFVEAVASNPSMAADRGMMIAWFANAIMAGYDTACARMNKKPNATVERPGEY